MGFLFSCHHAALINVSKQGALTGAERMALVGRGLGEGFVQDALDFLVLHDLAHSNEQLGDSPVVLATAMTPQTE